MNREISGQLLTQQTLGELIRRSLEGDREAFGLIVRQYQGLVSGVTFGMTGDYHKSEDLAQETFLVAWKRLAELRDYQKLPQWFCGIARMLVRNDRSKNAAKPTTISCDMKDIAEKPACDPEPLELVIREERNHLVVDAITKIPERYRVPLVMSIRSGLSTPEIAAILEISEDTLYQRISRAKKFLRTELEKQVEHSIRASGPGEFFTLGVVAALPIAAKLTSAAPVLASAATSAVVSPEPVFATTGSTYATTFSFWGFLTSVVSIISLIFFWFFWVVGAVPGLWFSIRNAPTLRARRYLTLTSLRLHFLLGLICSFYFFAASLRPTLGFYFFSPGFLRMVNFDPNVLLDIYDHCFYFGLLAIGGLASLVVILSPITYRRIVREDTGLTKQKTAVSLEESSLSYQRLKRSFFRYGCMLLGLYLLTVASIAIDIYLTQLRGRPIWVAGCGLQSWEIFFRYRGTLFGIVGLLFLIAFRQSHRHFLQIAKDEDVFLQFPPLVTRETPFRKHLFLEWIVFFGIFLAAGLIAVISVSYFAGGTVNYSPRSPFLLFTMLLLMFGGSLGVSAISVRFPTFRWITNILGLTLLVAAMTYLHKVTLFLEWQTYPFAWFFDSMASWPIVFSVIVLDVFLIFAAMTVLCIGGVYLRAQWNGSKSLFERFPSRRTVIFIMGVIALLVIVPAYRFHSQAKRGYFALLLISRSHDEWNPRHHERMITLATDCLHSFPIDMKSPIDKKQVYSIYVTQVLYSIRAEMYLREGKYEEAAADYDELFALSNALGNNGIFGYYDKRGQAKFGQGDLPGAIEDFKKSIETTEYDSGNQWYHLGYAYEKLGNLESAIVAYSKAIEWQDGFRDPIPIKTFLPRPGYDDATHLIPDSWYGYEGYRISMQELIAIRDRLVAVSE